MSYILTVDSRKLVVKRIHELTLENPRYTKMPRCAYVLRGIVLEKDNTVTLEVNADLHLVSILMKEGLLAKIEDDKTPQANKILEDDAQFTDVFKQYEGLIEKPAMKEKPIVRFPLSEHNLESVRNLVFTIYSKGELISKSTGGCFEVSEDLVAALMSGVIISKDEALELLRTNEGLKGLKFDSENVIFEGLPETDDSEKVAAWTTFFTAINNIAIKQYHVYPVKKRIENEKYDFHTWITRIGLGGKQYKNTRRILYEKLSGHTAFRTPDNKARWKARHMLGVNK